jgi:hypothetical protein
MNRAFKKGIKGKGFWGAVDGIFGRGNNKSVEAGKSREGEGAREAGLYDSDMGPVMMSYSSVFLHLQPQCRRTGNFPEGASRVPGCSERGRFGSPGRSCQEVTPILHTRILKEQLGRGQLRKLCQRGEGRSHQHD